MKRALTLSWRSCSVPARTLADDTMKKDDMRSAVADETLPK